MKQKLTLFTALLAFAATTMLGAAMATVAPAATTGPQASQTQSKTEPAPSTDGGGEQPGSGGAPGTGTSGDGAPGSDDGDAGSGAPGTGGGAGGDTPGAGGGPGVGGGPEQPTVNDPIGRNPNAGQDQGSTGGGGSGDGGGRGENDSDGPDGKKGDRDKRRDKDRQGGTEAEELDEEDEDKGEEDLDGIFGPAPIAVPNPVLDSFEIPPFLLPIYQSCGTQYAIPWQLLAAINKIETAFGTNLSVSYAGAMGWMQFMPGTWDMYGVDANGDGRKDPYNPVDAICAAARYLKAAGGTERLRDAIFAYNHANWYVEDVLALTEGYSQIPEHLISSLSGMTEGAHFPVAANARYADQVTVREAIRKANPSQGGSGNVAEVLDSSPDRRSVTIFSRPSAPVVAVNDGVIQEIGQSEELGHYVILQDVYGNRFTYAGLGDLMNVHPVPKREELTAEDFEMVIPDDEKMPANPASSTDAPAQPDPESIDAAPESSDRGAPAGSDRSKQTTELAEQIARRAAQVGEYGHDEGADGSGAGEGSGGDRGAGDGSGGGAGGNGAGEAEIEPINTENARQRVFARPHRPNNVDHAALTGQLDPEIAGAAEFETFKATPGTVLEYDSETTELKPLRKGSRVIAGTLLGRATEGDTTGSGTVQFSIRPSGKNAPAVDPKPILDGWRLLEATAIYRAKRDNPFFAATGVSQILMLPKSALIRRVINDPRLEIYSCGRDDIANGMIDRRVLAVLSYLAERGFRLTVTSLLCGRSGIMTASGNVSNHVSGRAVDIAALNGEPIIGNQGPGSLTEAVLQAVLRLQGTMVPSELISLHEMGGPSFAMGDHDDHIHIGYRDENDPTTSFEGPEQILEPAQWTRLMDQLGRIENPTVPLQPSDAATPATAEDALPGADSGDAAGGVAADE